MRPALIMALLTAVIGSFPAVAADEFALLKSERIGPLRIDLPERELERSIACKPRRGPVTPSEVDGDSYQKWAYPACGVILDMGAATPKGRQTIRSITITRPNSWKTRRGIGIGSTEREVMAAYGRDREMETSVSSERLVAGTLYGGLVFTFHQGRVVRIFLGAAAE